MKRWILLLMTVLMVVPLASAIPTCEKLLTPGNSCLMLTPELTSDDCSEFNYTVFNSDGNVAQQGALVLVNNSIYQFQFNQTTGDYIARLCDGSTRELRVIGRDEMGSLAVAIFALFSASILLLLPFFKERFAENEMLNVILKRSCWTVGIYLMMLNSGIMISIAQFTGLNINNELTTYIFLFGIGGYLLIFFIVFKTFMDIIKMLNESKKQQRMGEF